MFRKDLDIAVDWAAREGWNPGLNDADAFYAADPGGFFMAFDRDEPIGSISAVAYGDGFGFVGFFIVKPEYRGHRIGIDLARQAFGRLGSRNIGADGVENKMANYQTHGFRLAYHNLRYRRMAQPAGFSVPHIRPIDTVPFESIARYDARCFPAPRDEFLKRWLKLPDSRAVAWLRNDELKGYAMIRKCGVGYKFGPLFADDETIAAELFAFLESTVEAGAPLFLDIPEPNRQAMALGKKLGMTPVFGTARMYNREFPSIDVNRIFGVTSFELG
ncbi:MAG: GNAT family N-acetyltransferase [Verrucomicrobiae bacterium]|nr:GNAT family N-acetyltransferase [Verrucomicrobiae bacterium]